MTIGVGIIGCGAVSDQHVRAALSQQCRIVACADPNREAAARLAAQFDIPRVFTHADELLPLKQVDVVAICAPPKWHAALLHQALESGKHVMIEKPLAINFAEACAIADSTSATDKIVGVALMHRYQPIFHLAREVVQGNYLGPIRKIDFSLGKNMYQDSRFASTNTDPRAWLVDRSIAGGGVLMSSSIHFFSALSYVMGELVARQVSGSVRQVNSSAFDRIEDDVELTIRCENDLEYHHRESWAMDLPYRVQITGDDGSVVILGDGYAATSLQVAHTRNLPVAYRSLPQNGIITQEQLQQLQPSAKFFEGLWEDMVASIHQRQPVSRLPGVGHARNLQAIIDAAYQMDESRNSVEVDWRLIDGP